MHPGTVQTSTRASGRAGHRGGHPQGQRGRVSALSFAAPGAEASDACDHEQPVPTGPPHRSCSCLSTTSTNTSWQSRRAPQPAPLPPIRRRPGPRVGTGWVEPAPPAPHPAPGCPATALSSVRPTGWAQREKGTAGRVLQSEWRLDNRGPSGSRPAAQRIRKQRRTRSRAEASLAFHTPAPTGTATSEGCRDASGKGLGRAQRQGSLGAHCTRGPEDGLPGDSVPVGAARGPRRFLLRPPCVPRRTRSLSPPSRRPKRGLEEAQACGGAPRSEDPGERTRAHSLRRARLSLRGAAGLARGAGRTGGAGGRKCH